MKKAIIEIIIGLFIIFLLQWLPGILLYSSMNSSTSVDNVSSLMNKYLLIIGIIFVACFSAFIIFKVVKIINANRSRNRNLELVNEFEEIYSSIKKYYKFNIRNARIKSIKTTILIILLLIVGYTISIILKIDIMKIIFVLAIVFPIWVYMRIRSGKASVFEIYKNSSLGKYKFSYKEGIIGILTRYINPTLQYRYDVKRSLEEAYKDADFEERRILNDWITADDYMVGSIGNNTILLLGDMHVLTKDEFISDNDNMRRTVFRGLFANLSYPNRVQTEIWIVKNNFIKDNKNRLKIDSDEFEKCFDVYSLDQYEAKAILNTYLIQRLVEIYDKYKIKFEIIIRPYNIYLRMFTGGLFESGINPIGKNKLYKTYCIIKQAHELLYEIKIAIESAGM